MKKELSRLVRLLASGESVSGRLIGEDIGASRTSVSKWVSQLDDVGLTVSRQAGVGYCLSRPLQLLQADKVQQQLAELAERIMVVEVLDCIDSTNTHVLSLLQHHLGGRDTQPSSQSGTNQYAIALAEYQTAGRGRRGRSWVSPYASNINLSIGLRASVSLSALSGLSLAIGLAICQVLRRHGFDAAALKWPNDVLIGGRKLAGVLVDAQGEMDGPVDLSVGVGLNVRMQPTDVTGLIAQPWISLDEAAEERALSMPDRSVLAGNLAVEIIHTIDRFMDVGFAGFQSMWSQFDVCANEMIELTTQLDPDAPRTEQRKQPFARGINKGVDEQGRLLLMHPGAEAPLAYSGGEVSLRRQGQAASGPGSEQVQA